jgi:hypothetical protein
MGFLITHTGHVGGIGVRDDNDFPRACDFRVRSINHRVDLQNSCFHCCVACNPLDFGYPRVGIPSSIVLLEEGTTRIVCTVKQHMSD